MILPDYITWFKFLSKTAYLCGVDILDPNFKFNVHTYWIGSLITLFHLASFYTIIDSWPDMEQIVQTLSTYGICIQVSNK